MTRATTLLGTAIASFGLMAAPVSAKTVPTVTYEESVGCMKNGVIFFTAAHKSARFGTTGDIKKHTMFWAEQSDQLGTSTEAEAGQAYDDAIAMAKTIFALETEDEVIAFVAPYQAEFDACTAKRAALQAG